MKGKIWIDRWIRESNLIESVDDVLEDARSQRAWNYLKKWDRLFPATILRCHHLIMLKKLPGKSGKLRTCNVRVGDRICPDWQSVPSLFNFWMEDFANATRESSIQEAHIQFERIHPFIDGNGRTGRMVMNFQRIKAGLKPLCIEASNRWDYYRWFE